MFLGLLPLPRLPPRRKPRKGPRRSAGSEHRGGIFRDSSQDALRFLSRELDNVPVGIVVIPTISVSVSDSGPSRNCAGVIGIHERNRSGLMQFVPEFLKSRTTHNISLLLIFWGLCPFPDVLRKGRPGRGPPIGGSDANQFPSFTGDGLNDSPIRQLLFLAPVISENVYFEVQPKTGIVGQLAEKDRFGRDENKPAPQQGP